MIGELLASIVENSEAGSVGLLALYLAYEIRFGKLAQVQSNNEAIAVALYRVLKRDDQFDEEAFREEVWGEEDTDLLLSDLEADPPAKEGD